MKEAAEFSNVDGLSDWRAAGGDRARTQGNLPGIPHKTVGAVFEGAEWQGNEEPIHVPLP